ncbi:unnamed protein product, partial [Urochloa humidicola]
VSPRRDDIDCHRRIDGAHSQQSRASLPPSFSPSSFRARGGCPTDAAAITSAIVGSASPDPAEEEPDPAAAGEEGDEGGARTVGGLVAMVPPRSGRAHSVEDGQAARAAQDGGQGC